MNAKKIASIALVFIAIATGPIAYFDHSIRVNEHEKQTYFCAKLTESNTHPSCLFHNMKPEPSLSEFLRNWASDAGPFIFILFMIYIPPIVWRFIIDRLREISRAIRGMD